MKYTSTRGPEIVCSGAEAIRGGMAPDSGLYVPLSLPWTDVCSMNSVNSYPELAAGLLRSLLPDYSAEELKACAAAAYTGNFDNAEIVPLLQVGSRAILELWHGPTSAFKDMALQIMPRLLTLALEKTGEAADILILVATSGDTGKAALEGFRDIPRTRILVFYPSDGVSEVQRLQMATQEGGNVGVVAVEGNFDDAQTGVKKIFADPVIKEQLTQKGLKLSSANSINWGRLAPQIAYYFSAYKSLCSQGRIQTGDLVNYCVPTGNFGNILAGYYAKRMGLPVGRLICASNANNVLTEFLQTGVYDRNRPFHQTSSPSMDILVSSNLERLLFHATDGDAERVRGWMGELADKGRYKIDPETFTEIRKTFWADWASESEARQMISRVWEQEKYLLDPHTAVAWKVAGAYDLQEKSDIPMVVLSTASPFKFADSVLQAIDAGGASEKENTWTLLSRLSERTGWRIPAGLADLASKPVQHREVCRIEQMPSAVLDFANRKRVFSR